MSRFMVVIGPVYDLASRPHFKMASLILLAVTLYLDVQCDVFIGPQWTFLLFYMILNMVISETVGGRFAYAFAVLAALCRSYTGTLVWNGFATELWSATNVVIGFTLISYLIQQKNNALRDLKQSSLTDPLTKLPNRRAFNDRLDVALAQVHRHGETMSVGYIDVDGFKGINDTLGHQRGDDLLVLIGKTIIKNLRADDLGARLGGDEFAIIFVHTAGGSDGLMHRIKADLDIMCKEESFNVTFSIGVVNYNGNEEIDKDKIIKFADSLMYDVKKNSKNGIKVDDFRS